VLEQQLAVYLYVRRQRVQPPEGGTINDAIMFILREVHHLTPEQCLHACHALSDQPVADTPDGVEAQVAAAAARALEERPL
jgi:hypothetical protein